MGRNNSSTDQIINPRKNDTAPKSHVSDVTVSDSIVLSILEPSSMSAYFADIKDLIAKFTSKLDNRIQRLTGTKSKRIDRGGWF